MANETPVQRGGTGGPPDHGDLVREVWSMFMSREVIGKTWMRQLSGSRPTMAIQIHRDLEQGRGDRIRYDLLGALGGYGKNADAAVEQNEAQLSYAQDSVYIDQKREGVAYMTTSQQNTIHDLRRDATRQLSDWYARVYDEWMFAQLAGTAGDNAALATDGGAFAGGRNDFTAPSSARLLDKSTVTMDLAFIVTLREMAVTGNGSSIIQPLSAQDSQDGRFALVLHPYAVTSLKIDAGQNKWIEIMAQADPRGRSNRLFSGQLGVYDNTVLYESIYIPRVATGDINHNVFLGRQAGHLAFGNPYSRLGRKTRGRGELFSWFEQEDDYGNRTGVAAGAIWGIKKATFDLQSGGGNPQDFAVITLQTSDAPTG